MSDSQRIKVKIADLVIAKSPIIITTFGLGSCVAVMLYDSKLKVGGMNHFLLPKDNEDSPSENPAKYSDSGIELLIHKLEKIGAQKERMIAKLVGGANMFPTLTKSSIGQKNINAALETLKKHSVDVIGMDTGGSWGRSVEFHLSNGTVYVRSYKKGDKEI
jgi:chemotaxis protein CheD